MDTNFKRLMGDATRLTRSGDPVAATRAIRQALGGGDGPPAGSYASPPVAPGSNTGPGPGAGLGTNPFVGGGSGAVPTDADGNTASGHGTARTARRSASGEGPVIIEGEWRRTGDPASAPSARRSGTGGDSGVRGGTGRAEGAAGTVLRARHEGRAGALDYRLFVPPRAPDAPPPALVVMLHGCTQDAEDFATGTRMDALALEHGFLALYPEQSGRANPQRCWNWFKHVHQRPGRGEPGMIEETVRAVIAGHGVDPARVFVAGLSAGGAMAAILGDVCPELFAAVGVHSGLAAGSARDLPGALAAMRGTHGAGIAGDPMGGLGNGVDVPVRRSDAGPASRQPPTIVFHGDADRTVHPENGERVVAVCLDGLPTASEAGLSPERHDGHAGGRGWTRQVHRDAAGTVVAERWTVRGAGHAWSGGNPRGSYADAAGPDASAELVRFFLAGDER